VCRLAECNRYPRGWGHRPIGQATRLHAEVWCCHAYGRMLLGGGVDRCGKDDADASIPKQSHW